MVKATDQAVVNIIKPTDETNITNKTVNFFSKKNIMKHFLATYIHMKRLDDK